MWSVLIGVAILVCGIIIGVCLTLIVVRNRVIELIQHPEKRTEAMVARLDRALDLKDEQRAEVRDILQRHRSEFSAIRREVGPRIKNQIEALDRDISAVLDAEQKEKWDRYLQRLRRLWTPRFRGRGGG
jgi:septal ring factor EnvC (AmiA/AmiB activator)